MEHLERRAAGAHHVSVAEIAVERDDRGRRHPEPARLFAHGRVERKVGRMQQTARARSFAQIAERADMVDVRVRVHEVGRANAESVEPSHDALDLVAAVDDDRLAARLVGDDRAVAAERSDREMFDDH